MAMGNELSQRQFYSMAQRILADRDRLAEENGRLRAQPAEAEGAGDWSGLRLAAKVAEEDGPWEPHICMTATSMRPRTFLRSGMAVL